MPTERLHTHHKIIVTVSAREEEVGEIAASTSSMAVRGVGVGGQLQAGYEVTSHLRPAGRERHMQWRVELQYCMSDHRVSDQRVSDHRV